jgi:hypothetical protein
MTVFICRCLSNKLYTAGIPQQLSGIVFALEHPDADTFYAFICYRIVDPSGNRDVFAELGTGI